jgi:HK97 family phage major capsid protein
MAEVNVIDEIKSLISKNVSQEVLDSKILELKSSIEKRTEDLKIETKAVIDAEVLKVYTELEKTMELKAKENLLKQNNGIVIPDVKTYGSNFGAFLHKVRANDMQLKALSENIGVDGGYLVPDYWSNEIIKMSLEGSVIRPKSRVVNMPGQNFTMPYIKSSSNAKGSIYGGVTTYWASEGEDLSLRTSKPAFGKLKLEAHKMIGYTEAESELQEDAMTSIGGLLQTLFAEAIAFEEDDVFFTGNGIGKPLGVLSAACRVSASRTTASTIGFGDVIEMYSKFTGNLGNAVWIVNQSCITQLFALSDDNGNNIFFPALAGGVSKASPGTLLGIPIQISEKASALGTEGDMILADFGYYMIGDYKGLRIEESTDYKFNTDARVWKFVKRLDARPWIISSITPRRGGTALSPFVTLV